MPDFSAESWKICLNAVSQLFHMVSATSHLNWGV